MDTNGAATVMILAARDVRLALVDVGDVRSEVGFQNDINFLLSQLDDLDGSWLPARQGDAGAWPALPA